ncbi:pseudouridine synthase [Kosmotoga arenicorallina S304]|uniref:Pseudouridine synthase n=1 Tax=Kosmotoga arenicorallina S304 TaxID=1453497 RepID=A0A182C7U0_9BACT|nr:RluA family pseudouridine synthase [Kosmotoga arenicorallina]OAA31397.1 pseudouridine synthase [Kosmotoga arenicorallina S304]
MPQKISYIVSEDSNYNRLDKFLRHKLKDFKLSSIYKLLRTGCIRVNDSKIKDPAYKIEIGDKISVEYTGNIEHLKRLKELRRPIPYEFPFNILYEDEELLIIDKPPGISMHPGKGVQVITLVEGLMGYGNRKGFKPFLVHRLDKHTSGVLLVAKKLDTARKLAELFRNHKIDKYYLTLVKGHPVNEKGYIKQEEKGITEELIYNVKELFDSSSLLMIELLTGKKHQIRRQCASIGHPVVGDNVYGDRNFNREFKKKHGLRRYFLHCFKMSFRHPVSGKPIQIISELPDDLVRVLKSLRSS